MATKIDAGDVKRSDLYMVDPFQVIVKEELRGRHVPPTDEVIVNMALSMSTHGQHQAVQCRKINDNKLLLILGFTRTAAARLIRTGFTNPETGEEVKDEQFKLKVVLTDANDQKAFLNNIVENAHRNNTSHIDDAHNQHRLRDAYGYSETEIANLYQYKDASKVSRLRKLLQLPNKAQMLIHTDKLSMQAALDILDIVDDAARNEALEKVYADIETNGKANTSEVRSMVRQHHLNDDDKEDNGQNESDEESPKVKAKPLSSREVRGFWEGVAKEHLDDAVKAFAKTHLLWLSGRRSDKTMSKAIETLLDAQRS